MAVPSQHVSVAFSLVFFFLQHFIGQREEFETARDSILVWLTEMDLQLTNIEHFSECDVQAKIKQLKVTVPDRVDSPPSSVYFETLPHSKPYP